MVYFTELLTNEGYRLLSSPVSGTTLQTLLADNSIFTQCFTGADYDGDQCDEPGVSENVFFYDTSTEDWAVTDNITNSVGVGTGVLVYVYEDDDVTQEGVDGGFPKTISVSGTENAVDTSPTLNDSNDGLTLVGNPFASTIDFDNTETNQLTDVAYVWDPNDDSGDAGTDSESAGGSWKSWNGTTGDLENGLIAPFQGFFVQNQASVTSPSIIFDADSKTTGGDFLGKEQNDNAYFVRLELNENDGGLSNSSWLQFSQNGSANEKVMGDALEFEALSENFAELAFTKENTLFDIAHVPFTENSYDLPLSIKASSGGNFTLTATDFEIPDDMELVFHDYESGTSEVIGESFNIEIEIQAEAAKGRTVSPADILKNGPTLAKSEESSRYGISVMSKTAVSNEPNENPISFALEQNYPNPFNPTTSIRYSVVEPGNVTLEVYNIAGQRVETLVRERKSAGTYQVSWNASSMASGVYYYRLQAGNEVLTRKMTLIK